jgi:hypothetical protein
MTYQIMPEHIAQPSQAIRQEIEDDTGARRTADRHVWQGEPSMTRGDYLSGWHNNHHEAKKKKQKQIRSLE